MTRDFVFRNTFRDIEWIVRTLGEQGTRFEFECYDVGHLYTLAHFVDAGVVEPPLFVQSVFGILGGIGPDVENLIHVKATADRLFGADYQWSVLGAGRHQTRLVTVGAIIGGNVRVGLEDSIYLERGVLARDQRGAGREDRADPARALARAGHARRRARDARAQGIGGDEDRLRRRLSRRARLTRSGRASRSLESVVRSASAVSISSRSSAPRSCRGAGQIVVAARPRARRRCSRRASRRPSRLAPLRRCARRRRLARSPCSTAASRPAALRGAVLEVQLDQLANDLGVEFAQLGDDRSIEHLVRDLALLRRAPRDGLALIAAARGRHRGERVRRADAGPDRLADVIVHAGGEALLAIAGHRVGGHRDDRQRGRRRCSRRRISARRLVAVELGHLAVHQHGGVVPSARPPAIAARPSPTTSER